MADFLVREATPDDVEGILDVYEALAEERRWIGAEPPVDRRAAGERRHRWIHQPDALILVAEAGSQIVGELALTPEGGGAVAHLGMGLLARWRGRGAGSAMMDEAIGWARAQGFDKVFLHVWPHNDAAIALYEKFGFAREGYHPKHFRRRSGEAWDAISMGLLLR